MSDTGIRFDRLHDLYNVITSQPGETFTFRDYVGAGVDGLSYVEDGKWSSFQVSDGDRYSPTPIGWMAIQVHFGIGDDIVDLFKVTNVLAPMTCVDTAERVNAYIATCGGSVSAVVPAGIAAVDAMEPDELCG